MHHVIIGNGITGITAARTLRKLSKDHITVISGETDLFFSRTALMYIYMGHMRFKDTQPYPKDFFEKNNISLKKAWVSKIDSAKKTLHFDSGDHMQYDNLLIATGSKSNRFGWPGQDLKGVQGLYSYQDLLELEENTRNGINRAVIVGGGLIGIEMAEMLHARHYPVTLLVRESNYWSNILPAQESALITNHIQDHGFDLRLNTTLKEIKGDANGRVTGIITDSGEEIPCQVVGLTAGVSPNISVLQGTEIKTDRGVLINKRMQTSVEGVFAAGDCAQFTETLPDRRPVEQVWYTGKIQGECAAKNMLGINAEYDPGYWFNSAKFLDVEYQTYGTVLSKLRDGESEFYWEHNDRQKCVHIVFNSSDHKFIGINTFGIRMRHKLFNTWLQESRSVEYVMAHLRAAQFDPEFYSRYEENIIDAWHAQFPEHRITQPDEKTIRSLIFNA